MSRTIRTIHAYHAFGEALREPFREAFPDREYVVWSDEAQFESGLGSAEVLLALHPPRGRWGSARRLRLLQMTGAGVDSVLPAPDLPEEHLLANARGIHEPEMSEFALALVLALAKRLPLAIDQGRRREWRMFGSHRLSGKTAGILGLGTIGHALAQRLAALGMRVIGTRRHPAPLADVAEVLPPDETSRVLREADILVIVLPLTPETRGLLDAPAIASLKRGAQLVNIARGGIVDELALAEALREGRLAGAALDVFDQEPLPPGSPLWEAPNLILTPHVAGVSRDYMQRLGALFFENIRRLERGAPLRNGVDRARGY